MEIQLKIAQEQDAQLWDRIVESSQQGTLFHSWKWLKIAEKHTQTQLYPLMGIKGETVIGILPIFLMKKFGISAAFSPPPSTAIPILAQSSIVMTNINKAKKNPWIKIFREVSIIIF